MSIFVPSREDINNSIAKRMAEARIKGALYHATNPADNYFCEECNIFGKGGTRCWSCDSPDVLWQYVPRWGGGAQTMIWDDTLPTVSAPSLYPFQVEPTLMQQEIQGDEF